MKARRKGSSEGRQLRRGRQILTGKMSLRTGNLKISSLLQTAPQRREVVWRRAGGETVFIKPIKAEAILGLSFRERAGQVLMKF